jgi:O-antigen/teichoic acid export membrane protein
MSPVADAGPITAPALSPGRARASVIVPRPVAFRVERLSARTICPTKSPLRLLGDLDPADAPSTETADASQDRNPPRRRSAWALADQGIVSLGNSATNVLLARALAVGQFGAFSILLEAMLFLNSLQAALVIYPLSVRGAVLDRNDLRRLSGACLLLTLLLGVPLGLAVAAAAGFVASVHVGLVAVAALAMGQCQETLRRAMMARGGHRDTLPADAISYLGQAACVLAMVLTGTLTLGRVFAVMGLTSALAVVVQSIQIRPSFEGLLRGSALRRTAQDFWTLGRWVMLGNLTALVTTLACTWALALFHGTDEVGRFQALANLLKLSNPLTICMAGLIVPAAARAFRHHGIVAARFVTMRYAMLTVAALLPYYLMLLILPALCIELLYGTGSAYAGLENQLRVFVLWYGALLVAQAGGCFLNAIEQSRRSFVAQAAQTAAVVLIALPLTAVYGLNGLMLGGVIGNVVMAACYLAMSRRVEESDEQLTFRVVSNEMRESSRLAA